MQPHILHKILIFRVEARPLHHFSGYQQLGMILFVDSALTRQLDVGSALSVLVHLHLLKFGCIPECFDISVLGGVGVIFGAGI